MPDTFTQIHLQLVFAVKYRAAMIHAQWEIRLYQYMSGIVRNQGHKLIAINGMPDHIHLLLGLRPQQSVSDLVRVIKSDSSEWVNKMSFTNGVFRWQEGYGAFSYHKEMLPAVCHYIESQKLYHQHLRFSEEYQGLLKEFAIDYKSAYLFKEPE